MAIIASAQSWRADDGVSYGTVVTKRSPIRCQRRLSEATFGIFVGKLREQNSFPQCRDFYYLLGVPVLAGLAAGATGLVIDPVVAGFFTGAAGAATPDCVL